VADLPQPFQPAPDPGADPAEAIRDADEVEFHPCPRCDVRPGSPCRSRSGAVAGTYEWTVSDLPYVIVYEIDFEKNPVVVIGVFHGAQNRRG